MTTPATDEEKTLPGRKRVFWMLHYSIVIGVVILFPVSLLLMPRAGSETTRASGLDPNLLFAIFCLMSVTMIVIGYVLPTRIPLPGRFSEFVLTRLAARQVQMILTDAFFESVAIFGLVGLILGLKPWMGWGLMALSLALLACQAGRYAGWLAELGGPAREPGRGGRW